MALTSGVFLESLVRAISMGKRSEGHRTARSGVAAGLLRKFCVYICTTINAPIRCMASEKQMPRHLHFSESDYFHDKVSRDDIISFSALKLSKWLGRNFVRVFVVVVAFSVIQLLSTGGQRHLERNLMNGETSNLGEAVVFGMLGGPGSGKGTQSQLLSQAFNIVHISIGNVLREEMDRQGSPYGDIIRQNMMSGKVGPTEITIPILKGHISKNIAKGARGFILDGERCPLMLV